MKRLSLFVIVLGIFTSCTIHKSPEQAYLIIISMDGFRWDYTDSVHTPNFDKIAQKGIKAESMQVSFPSKTFPNHYTLVTGLVPNNHGIVNNTFYAPEYDEIYSIRDREKVKNGKFYGGEPIWNTAEKQGLKSASFFWVGSEADVQSMRPSYYKTYDHDFPFRQRVDSVIAWLSLEEDKRPHMISWYVAEPDGIGHDAGPHSPRADSVVQELDALLGYFMTKLENHPIGDQVNVIVTSDHGMGSISEEYSIFLNDYIKEEWVKYAVGGNPIWNVLAEKGFQDSIYLALENVEGLNIYRNPEVPKHLNYGSNERCLDFTIVADSSYSILSDESYGHYSKGTHGYDIKNKDMNAIFYAYGPAFKNGYVQPEFSNTSVYPLMCQVLQLIPAPNDGDFNEVKGMLK